MKFHQICRRQNGVGVSMLAWYHQGQRFDPGTKILFLFLFLVLEFSKFISRPWFKIFFGSELKAWVWILKPLEGQIRILIEKLVPIPGSNQRRNNTKRSCWRLRHTAASEIRKIYRMYQKIRCLLNWIKLSFENFYPLIFLFATQFQFW